MFRALFQVTILLLAGCILLGFAFTHSTTAIYWLMPSFAEAKEIHGNLWDGFELIDFHFTHPRYGNIAISKAQLKADWWGTIQQGWHQGRLPIYLEFVSLENVIYAKNDITVQWEKVTLHAYRMQDKWIIQQFRIDSQQGALDAAGELNWYQAGNFQLQWKNFHDTRGEGTLTLACGKQCTWHLHCPTIQGTYQNQPLSGFIHLQWHDTEIEQIASKFLIGKNLFFVQGDLKKDPKIDWNIDLQNFKLLDQPKLYHLKSHGHWKSLNEKDAELAFSLENRANQTTLNFKTTTLQRKEKKWYLTGKGTVGKNIFSVDGHVDLSEKLPQYRLHLMGDQLLISNTPLTKLTISPDVTFRQDLKGPLIIQGKVALDNSRIRLKQTGAGLTHSSDIQIMTDAPTKARPTLKQKAYSPLVDIALTISPNNEFEGFGIKTHFSGALRLQQTPHQQTLMATGKIQLTKGTYEGYSRKLNLVDSYLLYNGQPWLKPALHINAQRVIPHTPEINIKSPLTVGIHIAGDVDVPNLSFYSIPSLPENEILSYLLLGKGSQQASQAQAELLFDAFNQLTHWFDGDGTQNQIASALQLDEIRISTQGGTKSKTSNPTHPNDSPLSDVSVILGKQISEQFYLNYQIGLGDTLNTVRLHYLMGRHFEIQASTDWENSGADLIWYHDR